ncbi:MAG: hypothetical protein V3W52_17090 [Syntrophobacteria bacterium]
MSQYFEVGEAAIAIPSKEAIRRGWASGPYNTVILSIYPQRHPRYPEICRLCEVDSPAYRIEPEQGVEGPMVTCPCGLRKIEPGGDIEEFMDSLKLTNPDEVEA